MTSNDSRDLSGQQSSVPPT